MVPAPSMPMTQGAGAPSSSPAGTQTQALPVSDEGIIEDQRLAEEGTACFKHRRGAAE